MDADDDDEDAEENRKRTNLKPPQRHGATRGKQQ